MSKWKCEICNKEFDNFLAQGFDNKIFCPLCFFKEKTNRLEKEIKMWNCKWEVLKQAFIGKFNKTQDTIYLDILTDLIQTIENGDFSE